MGLLFTTEGTRRIINTLNSAFDESGDGLDYIRSFVVSTRPNYDKALGDMVSGRKWNAGDLAEALDLLPYDQGNGDGDQGNGHNPPHKSHINPKAKRRWKFFLTDVLGTTNSAFDTLRKALAGAILNQNDSGADLGYNIARVSFDHVEIDEDYVAPNSTTAPSLVVFDAPHPKVSTWKVRHITLFTARVNSSELGPQNPFDPNKVRISGQKWRNP